jgi:hypothetical protein
LYGATPSPGGGAYGPLLTGEAVADGYGYYAVAEENKTGVPRKSEVFEVDLRTGSARSIVVAHSRGEIWLRDADGPMLVWEWPQDSGHTGIWVWNRATGVSQEVTTSDDGIAGFARVGGDWIVYSGQDVTGYQISTGRRIILVPRGNHDVISGQDSDTDGTGFVVDASRQSTVFKSFHSALYWKPAIDS